VGAADFHRSVQKKNLPPGGLVDPGNDFYQRRLSGPVISHQSHNFLGVHFKIHIFQGMDAPKIFGDTPQNQDRLRNFFL
jgi:hypothetical protein